MSAPYAVRVFGDPVLKTKCPEVDNIDGGIKKLADDMLSTMYTSRGVGLAAPQIGVQKKLFVYDAGEGPGVVINPTVTVVKGEWTYDEGCLSVPGLFFPVSRPDVVRLVGTDLDGNDIDIEAGEFLGRIFQHEWDHLEGKLVLDRLSPDQRKVAMRELRERQLKASSS